MPHHTLKPQNKYGVLGRSHVTCIATHLVQLDNLTNTLRPPTPVQDLVSPPAKRAKASGAVGSYLCVEVLRILLLCYLATHPMD